MRSVGRWAGLLWLSTGCSFMFVQGPRSPPVGQESDCTRSDVMPAIDLAIGVGSVMLGVSGLSESKPRCDRNNDFFCPDFSAAAHVMGAIFLGVGALAVASSIYGFEKTHACRSIEDTQRLCREGSAEACARLVSRPAASPDPPR
jgi:hypothetical protein